MFRAVTFLCFGLSGALAQEPPVFTADSIRNTASLKPGITAGGIVTITGSHLTSSTGVFAADKYPLPTVLGGASVKVDGVVASLFSVSKVDEQEQITLQVPYSAAPLSAFAVAEAGAEIPATVEVNNGNASTAVSSAWMRQQPGIFGLDGNPAIFHAANGQMVTPEMPAAPDEALSIYATGFGYVDAHPEAGMPAPDFPLIRTLVPEVTVDGETANVEFSGLAPGWAGIEQVNVRVPADAPGGQLDLSLRLDNSLSNTVRLAVGGKPQILSVSAEPNRNAPPCDVLYYCDYIVTLRGKGFSRNATIEVVSVNLGSIFAAYGNVLMATSDTIQFLLSGASPAVIYSNGGFLITVVNPGGVRSNAIQQWSSTDHPDS